MTNNSTTIITKISEGNESMTFNCPSICEHFAKEVFATGERR